ncbi:hypothetical protein Trydic_g22612 [Trypoxylus dichotomus]
MMTILEMYYFFNTVAIRYLPSVFVHNFSAPGQKGTLTPVAHAPEAVGYYRRPLILTIFQCLPVLTVYLKTLPASYHKEVQVRIFLSMKLRPLRHFITSQDLGR